MTTQEIANRYTQLANQSKWEQILDELHADNAVCREPVVAGNFFTVALTRDLTFTNRPRMQMEEIGLFQVQDGRIVSEEFYY